MTGSLSSQPRLWIPSLVLSKPHSTQASCKDRRRRRRRQAAFLNTHTLSHPPSSLYLSWVTASGCCVRVSSAGAVWSGCVVSSLAERLLTGWMRESNTVYFNLFRMPELCPEFLLSLIPQLVAAIPHSCGAVWNMRWTFRPSAFTASASSPAC